MSFFYNNKRVILLGLSVGVLVTFLGGNNNDAKKTSTIPKKVTVEKKPVQAISRGGRTVGIGLTEGSVGFEKSFSLAKELGAEVVEIPVSWKEVEVSPFVFESKWLPIANDFYPKNKTKISLSLNPVDTTNLSVPDDLKNKKFDDEEVIGRYKALVDFAAKSTSASTIYVISVGNEVDVYLKNNADRQKEYARFYAAVVPYIHEKFPNAIIGSKMTFDGLIKMDSFAQELNKYSSGVLVTYYPFSDGTFFVKDISFVAGDFKMIVDRYSGKKIYFAEIGYPSGEKNKSSEEKQADFIKETFVVWDSYRDTVPFLNFIWMHDISKSETKKYSQYYGSGDSGFVSYLQTLGLRTYDGKDKQAFGVLQEELHTRGW